ncbi:oxygenase MpaB family protein [Gordonia sp. CPCC 206044]|uniref:oxygenase MpaB family protein n=1 Tax=Gordonia sp. CPCC 206044 TaxID=3140793 RepID=UPI003AF3B0E1
MTIPTRHPDQPCAIPIGIRAFALALGLQPPTDAEFRRLGECLTVGDEPADRLVDWMSATGMATTRPLFERALVHGVDSIPDAPEPLVEFFSLVEATPQWVDRRRLEVAGQVMRSGGADGLYVARDVALLGGYMFAGFNQTLLRTGALEKGSNQRFAETSQWATDVISEGGLDRGGAGYCSTLRVRLIHSMVRKHVAALPDWDADAFGLPINQTDMAATIVGALVAPSVGGVGLGLINRPSEYGAVAHLTRYVGWLMGIDDEFLPTDFRDCIRVLYHTSLALSTPDETTRQLSLPMVEDPLAWHYDRFPTIRRRLARAQHLGITSAFLGPGGMRSLGLPAFSLPWYPVVRLPVNLVESIAAMTLPGGRRRAADRGERRSQRFMRTMVSDGAAIGAAANHITGHAA